MGIFVLNYIDDIIACAHAINGTVSLYKCLQPRLDIFVDASLKGVGGALHPFVYRHSLPTRPGWSIAHWEAINIFISLQVFAAHVRGRGVRIWCDSQVAVAILHSGRGMDPILHAIARNIWLLQAALDCDLDFAHIPGRLNRVADLLSRWDTTSNATSLLYALLNAVPVWCQVPSTCLDLDLNI
jgi:hypothetical protein